MRNVVNLDESDRLSPRSSSSATVTLQLALAKTCGFVSTHNRLEGTFVFPYERNSILSFVPSRYGQVPSLTYATDCVVERIRWIVKHRRTLDDGRTISAKYVKVLRCLQIALGDAEECLTPETLCATELLAIFAVRYFKTRLCRPRLTLRKQLLGLGNSKARLHHVSGANRLIEHRGPTRFQSEFEKSLFVARLGSIVSPLFPPDHIHSAETTWL